MFHFLQCLDAIKASLADPLSSPAVRLSLTQRARRILQSKATKKRKLSYPEEGGATEVSKHVVSEDVPSYTLKDFPEEDVVDAPEVSSLAAGEPCG